MNALEENIGQRFMIKVSIYKWIFSMSFNFCKLEFSIKLEARFFGIKIDFFKCTAALAIYIHELFDSQRKNV